MNRDQVRGILLGSAIGDALGMPVEILSAREIKRRYGRITEYFPAREDHKFLAGYPAGKWTDDTQLTLVDTESMIACHGIDMDHIAQMHIAALHETESGWGGSTIDAVQRLEAGVHWSESGKTSRKNRGGGNGVAMKSALMLCDIDWDHLSENNQDKHVYDHRMHLLEQFGRMTHDSEIGYVSGIVQAAAVLGVTELSCHYDGKWSDDVQNNISLLINMTAISYEDAEQKDSHDRLSDRFADLPYITKSMPDSGIRELFGNGSCYVYESLPVAYALFLRKKGSMECIYDAVNFGGDTDTIASMVGALVGAMHGTKVFPQQLIDGLWKKDYILDVADRFCSTFGIED